VIDQFADNARGAADLKGVGWSPVQATPARSWVVCALKNWL